MAKRDCSTVTTAIMFLCGAGCTHDAQGPENEGFNHGTLVHDVAEFAVGSDPSWVTADSVLAFRSWDGMSSAIKLLDVATGSAQVLDGPVDLFGWLDGPERQLVSRRDGSTVFYAHYDPDSFSHALRAVSLPNGSIETLEIGAPPALALRPDDGALAYSSDDSVSVLDLSSMQRAVVAAGLPLVFSPDGSELLVDGWEALQRVHLATGSAEEVWRRPTSDLGLLGVLAVRWDTAGIRLLLFRDGEVEVFNPATGSAIGIVVGEVGERAVSPGTWSVSGDGVADRVAFWTEKCVGASVLGGCALYRRIVYVGNAQLGGATALAMEEAHDGSSALLFSANGHQLYYSVGGKLYTVGVP